MGGPDQKGYSMGRSGLKVWVGKGGGGAKQGPGFTEYQKMGLWT